MYHITFVELTVEGMLCAQRCAAAVEKAVANVPGVTSAVVDLMSKKLTVRGSFNLDEVYLAVHNAGYTANVHGKYGLQVTEIIIDGMEWYVFPALTVLLTLPWVVLANPAWIT